MKRLRHYIALLLCTTGLMGWAQEITSSPDDSFYRAAALAFEGDHTSSRKLLDNILMKTPNHNGARGLLAKTKSWDGDYTAARREFNKITSTERKNRGAWISAVKNELYDKNNATALGLANKALYYIGNDKEISRLRQHALENIQNMEYEAYSKEDTLQQQVSNSVGIAIIKEADPKNEIKPKRESDADIQNNRISINNSFTVFNEVYDPMIFSSISFKRQTLAGSIIPRLNYSNRLNKHGLQYDIDFYPKFSKRFYAYINYGYSNASIYPNHKVGGDLYVNLPAAIEFSAGMRYISFDTKDVSVITNSIGHYRGNYYFSLRSYITPQSNNLTRISGNLLVRKYLKDAENYLGINVGMGYSPELRQLRDGDELLAETLLYIESQRLRFEYQFTGKRNKLNIYRANLAVNRQELVFDTGNFFWGFSAGITYQVKF